MGELQLFQKPLNNEVYLIEMRGYVDFDTYEQLEDLINKLFRKKRYRLIFKLDKLEYISSAGAGVFIGAVGKARDHGGNIVFLKPNPNVQEVFDLLGLSQIFPFASDAESALAVFS